MGILNVLKSTWEGKVGQTVGAKWKNKGTIRTYTKPSNPNTAAQQEVRGTFAEMTSFVALFADGIKYLTALDTSGMSARNAIIKLNKEQIMARGFDASTLLISKGGLSKPQGVTVAKDGTSNAAKFTWTAPTAQNFTPKAKMVCVVANQAGVVADVFTAEAKAGEATGTVSLDGLTDTKCYCYFLDYRGSNKVASPSVYNDIA